MSIKIPTNIPAEKSEILFSILGQLSDGIWENSNSRKIAGIWMFTDIIVEKDGDKEYATILISDKSETRRFYKSGPWIENYFKFALELEGHHKSFVTKTLGTYLKKIVKEWADDNGIKDKKLFSKKTVREDICNYISDKFTIRDIREVYDQLMLSDF